MTVVLSLQTSLPPVRSQGLRGTCVAFALTCAHEHRRYGGNKGSALSEEALHWATKELDRRGDDASSFEVGAQALSERGQPLATVWPYVLSGDPGDPPAGCFDTAYTADAVPLEDRTVQFIREAIEQEYVVCAGIPLWLEFYRASNPDRDVIPFTESARENPPSHAVAFVGHDPGRRAIQVRNSWGPTWGINGYAWVSQDVLPYCSSLWKIQSANI